MEKLRNQRWEWSWERKSEREMRGETRSFSLSLLSSPSFPFFPLLSFLSDTERPERERIREREEADHERERERERERETGAESEIGRSQEKTRSEVKLSVEPENPSDPGGSETQENRSRNRTLWQDPDPIRHGSSLVMVPVAIFGGLEAIYGGIFRWIFCVERKSSM